MLTNFITSTDLQAYEPNLLNWLTGWSSSPASQISLATKRLITDLRNLEKDSRLVMLPLYLSSSANPYTDTITSNVTSTAVSEQRKNKVHRFVINKVSITTTGTNIIYLEGSNDNSNFETVTSITLTSGTGLLSASFDSEFKYYRYKVIVGTSLSLSAQIYLVETAFDECLCNLALYYIFVALSRSVNDIFDVKARQKLDEYKRGLEDLRFAYDYDESGAIDTTEESQSNNKRYKVFL